MKKIDKLKKFRYEVSMKIIQLESKQKTNRLTKKEQQELTILRQKEEDLESRIDRL